MMLRIAFGLDILLVMVAVGFLTMLAVHSARKLWATRRRAEQRSRQRVDSTGRHSGEPSFTTG